MLTLLLQTGLLTVLVVLVSIGWVLDKKRSGEYSSRSTKQIIGAIVIFALGSWISSATALLLGPAREQPKIRQTAVVLAEAFEDGEPRRIVCVTKETPRLSLPGFVGSVRAGLGEAVMTEAAYTGLLNSCVPFTGLDGMAFPTNDGEADGLDSDLDGSDEYECDRAVLVVDREEAAARVCEVVEADPGPGADSFRTPQGVIVERVDVTDDGRADFVLAGDDVIQLDRSSNLVEFGLVMSPVLLTSLVALYVASSKREITVEEREGHPS